ncbi:MULTISPECIES: hypothetical protein [Butyricimonas]|uniref:hypothetical protein n=1 Tax=Butyricimonas TaxID=574697 RepID=UPI001D070A04|nr:MULTISPECIES: hypothetical protein [Butyricimonas]MCB6970972.1 hypothetical protein [Butyricimonas synergistica]MCG4517686.1 hypothetical protein [Butyricimonas sp. DFI.6.44]
MEIKKCPYCGETINAGASKCRFCMEWLITPQEELISPEISSHHNYLLQLPQGSYYWKWGLLMIFLVPFIEGGAIIVSAMFSFMLGWGFFMLNKYMCNFQQKIKMLQVLPCFYLLISILILLINRNISGGLLVVISEISMILGIGGMVCGLIAGWQLMEFRHDFVKGMKSLGIFIFISNLILIFILLLSLYMTINYWKLYNETIYLSGAFFCITVLFIMNVFYKARRYNETINTETDEIEKT